MKADLFIKGMERLQDHFGKRLKDTAEYGQALSGIPGEAFEAIVRDRVWGAPPIPSRFPTIAELLDDWQGWLRHHPEQQAPVRWVYCPWCEVDLPGLIIVDIPLKEPVRDRTGHAREHRRSVVRCRHCGNSEHRNPTWPRYTWENIEERGWRVVTHYHEQEVEESFPVQRAKEGRTPGMRTIADSVPVGDRETEDDDIPF